MYNTNKNLLERKKLDEISFIRPILIVLLVLFHAFAPWCGSWRPFEGFQENSVYWWVGKLSYSYMLPMFVFISSYVFAYQRETLGKIENVSQIMVKKFRRLIVPSLLFSILYIPLLPKPLFGGGIFIHNILELLGGLGHMWFLPMLFWCFPLLCMLLKIKSFKIRFAIALIFAIAPTLPLPLQIGTALTYLFYFLLGYELYRNIENIEDKIKKTNLFLVWSLFLISFIGLTILKSEIVDCINGSTIASKLVRLSSTNLATILYSTFGIVAMLMTAIKYTSSKPLPHRVIKMGSYCFGVYIFQQFLLQIVYYHTSLPLYFGNELLPWIGFVGTLVLSLISSYMLRQTRVGRNLI